jgi:UDP-3-O-[3-hydroxymyristoyl] glucosamine N-acyltransferase
MTSTDEGPIVKLTVRQLAEQVQGEVLGDGDCLIQNARSLTEAEPGDITFVETERHLSQWEQSRASAAIVSRGVPLNGRPLIQVDDPLSAFATVVLNFRKNRPPDPAPGVIDARAVIHPTAVIGGGTSIGPFAVIREGVVIGQRCTIHAGVSIGRGCQLGDDVTLYPHVVLYDETRLGKRVIVHANSVLGADGFGYRTQHGKHLKVPQLGYLEIADDVEIGACTTIDRGTFGPTRIGEGTKIDNLVMIGHNCQIGAHNLLVSQVGIAGSTTTGQYVVMAGQVGIADHITIGDHVQLGGQSGVWKDVPSKSRLLGSPARPIQTEMRNWVMLEKLPELIAEVRRLKQQVGDAGE